MFIACSILAAAATISGGAAPRAYSIESMPTAPRVTLTAAVQEAAKRASPTLDRRQASPVSPTVRMGGFRAPGHRTVATRATAIVAGAILGSLGGMLGGAAIDAASGGECLTGMSIGLPVGGVLGGVITARLVR